MAEVIRKAGVSERTFYCMDSSFSARRIVTMALEDGLGADSGRQHIEP